MRVLPPASLLSGLRPAAWPAWARPALVAAAVAAVAAGAWTLAPWPGAAPPPTAAPTVAARRAQLEHCTEGALLRHDVRWAAVCMVLAQQHETQHAACLADPAIIGHQALGRGYCDRTFSPRDGSAECELPDAQAGNLNDLLQREEQRCMADAGWSPR